MLYSENTPSVIFMPGYAYDTEGRDTLVLETVLTHRMYRFLSRFQKQDVVGIKSCESESSQTGFYAQTLVHVLQRHGQTGFLCGTSHRHRETSSNAVLATQRNLADQVGDSAVIPYLALDGMYGEHEISHRTHRELDNDTYLAGELLNLDGVISVACFSLSGERDLGGAVVNMGQGLASKKGKIIQRTTQCPQVNVTKCYQCRRCVRLCPTRAIRIDEGHAVIDERKCIKCGKCVETAHYGGITYNWDASPEYYDHAVIRHARGVLSLLKDRVIGVNVVIRDKEVRKPAFLGGLIASDPVALDSATLDVCEQHGGGTERIQRVRDRLEIAEASGLGTTTYTLETVAY